MFQRTTLHALAALLACSTGAQAQQSVPESRELAPLQQGSGAGVWASKPLDPGRYALAMGVDVHPIHGVAEPSTPSSVTAATQGTAELLGTLGVWRRFDVSAGVSVSSVDSSDVGSVDPRDSFLEVARIAPRARLWHGSREGGGAFVLDTSLALSGRPSATRQGLSVEPRLVWDELRDWVRMSVNAGYRAHMRPSSSGRPGADALTWGLAADVPVMGAWSGVAEVSGRWYALPSDAGARDSLPSEARLVARFAVADWAAELGGGAGLLGASGEAHWRLLAAVSISPSPPPARHSDRANLRTQSTSLAPDDDACARALLRWNGGRAPSACAVHPKPSHKPLRTPERDSLVARAEPDVKAGDAAPIPRIEERIYFDSNSAEIDESQASVLDQIAAVMRSAPLDLRLLVEGHSDDSGPSQFNWELSRVRASTVRWHLIQRGISWRRVSITWYGPTRREDRKNASAPENRRVEIKAERVPPRPVQ
jgi:outer membrane protein OmpA-like peptidoglycan-associated protein